MKRDLIVAAVACMGFLIGYATHRDVTLVDLQRRQIYLDCLHEYAISTALGDEESDRFKARQFCASLAGLEDLAPLPPDGY